MENVTRVEIITDALEMREVCRLLESLGVTGFTIIRDVQGQGERGRQLGDELTDVFKNSLLLAVCEPTLAERVAEALRPILKRRGGMCVLTPARSVRH